MDIPGQLRERAQRRRVEVLAPPSSLRLIRPTAKRIYILGDSLYCHKHRHLRYNSPHDYPTEG